MSNSIIKACDGKNKYESEDAAQQHINLFQRESVQVPYKCGFCGRYHIATIPGVKRKRKTKNLPFGTDKRKTPKMKMKNKPGRRRKK